MKRRTGTPWMPAPAYAATLHGVGVNLLVVDVAAAVAFQTRVLGAALVYVDVDFAALEGFGSRWCLHADHTYDDHPLGAAMRDGGPRGAGVELRVHGADPDAAVAAALQLGYTVLQEATDKAHGLREAFIVDSDGYCWVPDVPLAGNG